MQIDIEYIEEAVVRNGYSSTPGWFGFYEKSGKYDRCLTEVALNHFFDYFKFELSSCSLFFDYSVYENISAAQKNYQLNIEEVNLLKYLHKKKWLRIIKPDHNQIEVLENKTYNFSSLNARELTEEEIFVLISAIIKVGDFIGHCFVFFKKLNLIIYPHEDIGFGIICTKGSSNDIADKFLKDISKNKQFNAYHGRSHERNRYKQH